MTRCVVVFVLTAFGLVVVYLRFPHPFLFVFGYLAAFVLLLAFAHDFLVGTSKLSRRKLLLLTLGVIAVATALTQSVLMIVSPSWSFSVSTDKSSYKLGEAVEVTVMLKNVGFITHSFKSSFGDPVVISINYVRPNDPFGSQVWYSPIHANIVEFSVSPNGVLVRSFVWNQTDVHSPESSIQPGNYRVIAFVPDPNESLDESYHLFFPSTTFNITAA